MDGEKRVFGKRGARPPPIKTHAPSRELRGLGWTIENRNQIFGALALAGACLLGVYAVTRPRDCPRGEAQTAEQSEACAARHGSGNSGGRSARRNGGSGDSARSASFGGFGHAGAAHSGGGA